MSTVYEIATKISMVNSVSPVLAVLSKEVLGLHGSLDKLSAKFSTLNRASLAMYGGLSMATGAAILGGMAKLVEHAEKLQGIQETLKIGGVHTDAIAKSTDKALAAATKYGLKWEDVLKTMSEIRVPLGDVNGDMEKSIEHIETLSASMRVLQSIDEKKGTDTARQMQALVKAAEFRNAVSDKDFDKFVDMTTRAAVVSGGVVTPQQVSQFYKYARGALPGLSDDFLYKVGPELIQEFGGQGAGNVLGSLHQQLVGGMMSTTSLQQLQNLGMLRGGPLHAKYNEKGKLTGYQNEFWAFDKHGRVVKAMKPGGIEGSEIFERDPIEFAKFMKQRMIAKGISSEAAQMKEFGADPEAVRLMDEVKRGGDPKMREQLAMTFRRMTTTQAMNTLMFQLARLERGKQAMDEAWNTKKAAEDINRNSLPGAMTAFTSAWSNLLTALGNSIAVIGLLNRMTDALNAMTAFVKAHPDDFSKLAAGIGVLGAVFLGGGAVAMMAAMGPGGWLALGLGALAAAASAVDWKPIFDGIGSGLDYIGKKLNEFLDLLQSLGERLGKWIDEKVKGLDPFGMAARDQAAIDAAGGLTRSGGGGAGFTPGTWGRNKTLGSIPGVIGGGSAGGIGAHTWAGDGVFDSIIRAEGTAKRGNPYNEVLGYGRYGTPDKPITEMTLSEAYEFGRKIRARHGSSSALGAFQIVGQTMKTYMAEAGLNWNSKFSEENQRKLAQVILRHQGFGAWEGFKHHPGELANARRALAPPPPPKPAGDKQSSTHHIYLDGKRILTALSNAAARANTHVRGNSAFDGRAHPTPIDLNYQTA